MTTINNSSSNINFTARLELSPSLAKKYSQRLENIAQTFETKTRHYKDDVFSINGREADNVGFHIYHYDKDMEHENGCDITSEQWNKLFEKPDEFIAKKLTKLFNIFKKKDKEYDNAGKYVVSVIKKDKNNDPTDFESKFWDIVVDKANSDMQIAAGKDAVIKNWKVY